MTTNGAAARERDTWWDEWLGMAILSDASRPGPRRSRRYYRCTACDVTGALMPDDALACWSCGTDATLQLR